MKRDAARTGAAAVCVVRLREVARIEQVEGPNQINRENGKRRVVVTANVRGRDLGGFVTELRERIEREVEYPAATGSTYGGSFEQLVSARQRLSHRRAPGAVHDLRPAVHGVRFGARRRSHLQWSAPGTYGWCHCPLVARHTDVDFRRRRVYRAIGSGRAQRHRHALLHPRCGSRAQPLDDAILDGRAGSVATGLMTALVASLGFVPMALNVGAGSEVQRPLATVVIGGVISSTLLTLLVLPALYRLAYRSRGV